MHKSEHQDVVAEKADDHSMKDELDSIESKSTNNILATKMALPAEMAKTNDEPAKS